MARSTLATLISELRVLANVGTADYTIASVAHWTDDQLQTILDRNRMDVVDERLQPVTEYNSGGTAVYQRYQSGYRNFEATDGGTAVYFLRTNAGARVGTASYTPDYPSGRNDFAATTGGSVFYLTGRSYDLNAAAAQVWDQKAGFEAGRYDFTADGASFKVSQAAAGFRGMAAYYRGLAQFGDGAGLRSGTLVRDDVALW
jgi:hypothetical protein